MSNKELSNALDALAASKQETRSVPLELMRFGGRCEKHLSVKPCAQCIAEMTSKPEQQAQAEKPLSFESAAEAKADREHAEKYYRQAERLLTANERTLHEAIAKKDAALKACLDALDEYIIYEGMTHSAQTAIDQAKEAMK